MFVFWAEILLVGVCIVLRIVFRLVAQVATGLAAVLVLMPIEDIRVLRQMAPVAPAALLVTGLLVLQLVVSIGLSLSLSCSCGRQTGGDKSLMRVRVGLLLLVLEL